MRRYDDPVEVRRGWVPGSVHGGEAPEQFLWRGRLWKVRAVLAGWIETGAWWASREVEAVLGTDRHEATPETGGLRPRLAARPVSDLLRERELWRVEAGRGGAPSTATTGVFELAFDLEDGRWALVGCAD
ncbi:MAG: DUF6504 family protein [Nocardioides sp.]